MGTHSAGGVRTWTAALAAACLALLVCPSSGRAGDPAPVPLNVDPTLFSLNADYIIHMDPQAGSSDYYPLLKGLQDLFAIDHQPGGPVGNPGGYHWGYVQLGFKQPYFSSDRNVYIYDCNAGDGDCDNGLARFSSIWLPAPSYINRSGPCTRAVLGHELFHHVEYAYIEPVFSTAGGCGGTWGKFVCEGQARAMQDKIYSDLDVNAALSCTAGFLGEVNNYLDDTTQAIWQSSYKGALFWTYLMEQYGTDPLEPTYGADFIRQFWEEAEDLGQSVSAYQAIGNAIDHFGSNDNVESAFHSFVLANYIKDLDLTGTSQAFQDKYSYRDGNSVDFDSVSLLNLTYPMEGETEVYNLTAPWWGARYDRFDFKYCPAGSTIQIQFLPILANDPYGLGFVVSPKLMMGVVVERNSRVQLYYRKRATGWLVQFSQPFDPYDQVIVTNTGIYGNVNTFVLASCIAAPPEPQLPLLNPLDPQTPGPPDVLTYGPIEPVFPIPPDPELPPLTAIDPHLFEVYVGGLPARVLGGAPTRQGTRLQVEYPIQPGPGAYDVRVVLGDLETTIPGGIVHGPRAPDVLALVDLSASMNLPPDLTKLQAAQFATHLFTDALMETGQLGLVSFAGNDTEPNDDAFVRLGLGALDATQRGRMHVAIDNLVALPGALTSVGDGIAAALEQLDAAGTSATEHHLVLLLDGGENEEAFWADVAKEVADSGVVIHTIAQGGRADQALAAEIADATGGQYHYADDLPPEADALALARAWLSVADEVERRRTFLDQTLTVGAAETVSVGMDSAPAPGNGPSPATVVVFVDPGGPPLASLIGSLLLEANGSPIVDGVDGNRVFIGDHYVVFQLADFAAGDWDLTITGASGLPEPANVELHASVHRPGAANTDAVTIVCERLQHASVLGAEGLTGCGGSADGSGATLLPEVGDEVLLGYLPGDPGGSPDRPLVIGRIYNPAVGSTHDLEFKPNEGAEEFTGQGSGFLSAPFRATSHGSPAGIPDNPPPPRQVGSYSLRVVAQALPGPRLAPLGPTGPLIDVDVEAVSIVRRSFHVLETEGGAPDRDGDALPDTYEDRYDCLDGSVDDALQDGDRDTLTNAAEMDAGTHPCTADTDEGGEQDGSEVRGGRNPLDPADDALPRLLSAYVLQQGFEHEDFDLWEPGTLPIMYDGHARFHTIVLKRGTVGRGSPGWDTVEFDPKLHPGIYLDRGLTPGQEYCYQLYGIDDAGNDGAPTRVFCATAKNDPEPPLGDLRLNDAAPSSDDTMLTATLDLYNKEPATTEMSIGVDEHPDFAWVPYQNEFPVDPGSSGGPGPRTVQVYAALRDAEGGVSEIYTDTIELWPPGSLGGITGAVQAAPSGTPLAGVYVEVTMPEGASPDATDGGGLFGLNELEPGSYTLKFSYPGYLSRTLSGVQVIAGQTTDVGVIVLGPGIFADGFE
jgi:Mg-chelatase subunit ChlD